MRRSAPRYGEGGPEDEEFVARSMARAATTGRNLWSPSTPRGRSDARKSRTIGGDQVEGRQAVRELLAAGRRQVREVWMTEGNDPSPILGEIDSLARARHIPVRLVSHRRLESVQGTESPQGVVAFAEPLEPVSLEELVLGEAWGDSSRPEAGRRATSPPELPSALEEEAADDDDDDERDALVFVELDDDLEELEGAEAEDAGEGNEGGDGGEANAIDVAGDGGKTGGTDEAAESAEADEITSTPDVPDGDGAMDRAEPAADGEAEPDDIDGDHEDEAEDDGIFNDAGGGPDMAADEDLDREASSDASPSSSRQRLLETPNAGRGAAPAQSTKGCFLVLLDGVTDPQNLGAILRSAECAGATGVVIPRHRSAHVTPAVTKAAAGAIEHLPMALVAGIPSALQELGRLGVTTVGLDERGEADFFDIELGDRPIALVLGAEGAGLGHLARRRCEVLAKIPLSGEIPSLNVSAAAAVACFEVARQRRG